MPLVTSPENGPILATYRSVCGNYKAERREEGWVVSEGETDKTTTVTSLIEDRNALYVTVGTTPVEFCLNDTGSMQMGETACSYCNTDPCYIFEVVQSVGIHEQIWRNQDETISEDDIANARLGLAVLILQSKGLIDSDILPECVVLYLDNL